jgi:hypothetical protein
MFNCNICKKSTQPGQSMAKVVIETRRRESDAGVETVKEISVCPGCASMLRDVQ